MALSVVIPVRNDRDGLTALLRQIGDWDCFDRIIIVDDASDQDLSPDSLPIAPDLRARIQYLRLDQRRGAGHARNIGLDRVQTSHLIFFDSDDLFAPDFPPLVRCAAGSEFDFLIFRHDDSRMIAAGGGGSFPQDESFWAAIGAIPEPRPLTPVQATLLCRLANYPWNKIYRTAFLRDNGIRCTETMVHNDIELHWASFLQARNIWASAAVGAVHVVAPDGARLTNQRSADRLCAFDTLARVARLIDTLSADRICRFGPPFFRFARDLQDWIADNLDAAHHPRMQVLARQLYLDHLHPDLMVLIAQDDPALAQRITRTIICEPPA